MGTGYTRNDTSNNIADGNIINAADLDGEFDAIESAMGTSGHTHDGTSAEGGPVTVLGPVQDFVASATEIKPKTTNTLDIGTNSLLFKDMFLDGVATIGSIKIDNAGTIGSASDGDAIAISSGGVVSFSQAPLVDVTNSTTNAVTDVLGIRVQSTGTPAVGIGSGLTLGVETAAGNVETGGAIRIVSTGLTPTSEEIDLVFYSMRNGSLTEAFRFDSSADSLSLNDSVDLSLGSDDDLTLVHSGAHGTVTNSTGNLTFDVAGDIILDADGGDIVFNNNGVEVGRFTDSSTDLVIKSAASNQDMIFKGNDGGSVITALTLDMSEAGAATFNSGITVGGDIDMTTHQIVFNNNSQAIQIKDSAGTASYVLYQDNSDVLILGNGTNVENIRLDTSGNEGALTIDTNGRTGVGMTPDSAVKLSVSGAVGPTNGSAGSPTHTFYSDADTGMYRAGPNTLGFSTGGSEAMIIDSSGNVGIDVSTVIGKLHVDDSDGATLTLTRTSGATSGNLGKLRFGNTNVDSALASIVAIQDGGTDNSAITFGTQSSGAAEAVRMIIDSSGNVGIGTDSPTGVHSLAKVLELDGGDGSEINLGLTATNVASGAFVGGIGFKNVDGSLGTAPHYAGIKAKTTNTSGVMDLRFYSGTGNYEADTPQMLLDGSGRVGIGQTAMSSMLHVRPSSDTNSQITMEHPSSGNSYGGFVRSLSGTDQGLAFGGYFNGTSTERMRIDSSGRVGIGGTPNTNWRDDIADQKVLMLGTEATLFSDAGVTTALINNAYINDSDAFINISTRGASQYFQYEGAHKWYTAASTSGGSNINTEMTTPKMILNVSGDLLINKTSTALADVGHELDATGYTYHTRDDANVLYLNRKTNDGNIIQFYKDTASVGSIGVSGNDFYVTGSVTNIAGAYFANSKIMPMKSGATSDATIDLGTSSKRFQNLYLSGGINNGTNAIAFSGGAFAGDGSGNDANIDLGRTDRRFQNLYLSGGVHLGGTGSANKLEDYEEGSYTPTVYGATTAGSTTLNSSFNKLHYTKIGRQVTIGGEIRISGSASGSGFLRISTPFTNINESGSEFCGAIGVWGVNHADGASLTTSISKGSDYLRIIESFDNASTESALSITDLATNAELTISITFLTS